MAQEIIIALVILILCSIFLRNAYDALVDDRVYVKASDGQMYKVRNTKTKNETADALARVNQKVQTLFAKLSSETNDNFSAELERLKSRYRTETLSEGRIDKRYTSYTVNKGEQVVLCLRTRDDKDHLYDDNLIFYVVLHELAHIASIGEDHTPEFHKNFRYLLKKAAEYGMFKKIIEKFDYCGMDVHGM